MAHYGNFTQLGEPSRLTDYCPKRDKASEPLRPHLWLPAPAFLHIHNTIIEGEWKKRNHLCWKRARWSTRNLLTNQSHIRTGSDRLVQLYLVEDARGIATSWSLYPEAFWLLTEINKSVHVLFTVTEIRKFFDTVNLTVWVVPHR